MNLFYLPVQLIEETDTSYSGFTWLDVSLDFLSRFQNKFKLSCQSIYFLQFYVTALILTKNQTKIRQSIDQTRSRNDR